MSRAEQFGGIIPFLGGIYLTLGAYRVIRLNPKIPEKEEWWHRKFGKMSKIVGPILIGGGILQFFGLL
jgi:hypothetical protein